MLQVVNAIKWPVALGVVMIVAIVILRNALAEFLRGLKHRTVKIGGTELAAEQAQLPPPGQGGGAIGQGGGSGDVLVSVTVQTDNAWINERRRQIEVRIEALGLQSDSQKCSWLTRELTLAFIANEFEVLYRVIYSSQISVLLVANRSLGAGLAESVLRASYDQIKARHPEYYVERDISFDSWLGFLLGQDLLRRDSDVFHLTVRGHTFLHFLVGRGYGDRADNDL
jgi:hypothetical protein